MMEDNPDYDPMEIIMPELEWTVDDDGNVCAYGEIHDYEIEIDNMLWVYEKNCKVFKNRQCVDLAHAEYIADAIETVDIRNLKRGCDWHGRPVA